MIDGIIVIRVVQLAIVQEARLGAAVSKVVMPVIYVAEAHCAAVMQSWTHVGVVPLAMTQNAVAPLGAFIVDVVSTILLALTAIEPPLALALPTILCVFVVPFLGYMPDGGIVDEGGTDSTTITPCRSSNVAVMGMVVVTSLVTSPYGVINMATIVCGG
jgi:hypothetical protein